jgi:hypothetical protein
MSIQAKEQVQLSSKLRISMPCYTLGENQVAGIKYENGHNYGKLIYAVDSDGCQRTSIEFLSEEWISANTDEPFRELLHAKQNVFIWVPVGAPSPDSHPYYYDKKITSIALQQDDRNTCATSSFASCLYYMLTSGCVFNSQTNVHLIKNLTELPAHIDQNMVVIIL